MKTVEMQIRDLNSVGNLEQVREDMRLICEQVKEELLKASNLTEEEAL